MPAPADENLDQIVTEPADSNPAPSSSAGPKPAWNATFLDALKDAPGGYAFVVRVGDTVTDSGVYGYARMSQDNPEHKWTTDTRCNLASVSKTITATAIFRMIQDGYITSVNDCFLPYITAKLLPTLQPAKGVDTVTIGELLMMTSRLPKNGTLSYPGGLVPFLNDYLSQNAVIPEQLYVYSNANFIILEGVVTGVCLSQNLPQSGYVEYVQQVLLEPLGIKPAAFSPVPTNRDEATLYYSDTAPTATGHYFPEFNLVGAGGWVASASDLCTYLGALFTGKLIKPTYLGYMSTKLLGWYLGGTCFGSCSHHNGGLSIGNSGGDKFGLSTGAVHFPCGRNAVLLVNSPVQSIIQLMIEAYDAGCCTGA